MGYWIILASEVSAPFPSAALLNNPFNDLYSVIALLVKISVNNREKYYVTSFSGFFGSIQCQHGIDKRCLK